MTYDAAGDLMTVTDPDHNVTTYSYNAAHEEATETTPTGGVYTYTYDPVGNLTQSVDPDGHTVTYSYNGDDELTSETWLNPLGGTPLDVFNYSYDGDGNLTAASDDNSAYQFTYNADGEVTSQGDVGSPDLPTVTLTYDYDGDGNRIEMADSLGGVVSYTYDVRDELTNETMSGTGISPEAVAFGYDNAGDMTSLTRYSNLSETTVVAGTSYTYDAAQQLTGINDENASGTTLVSYAYTYDAAGRVTQEVRVWDSGSAMDTLTYGYTNNDQLTSVTHSNGSFANESFSWDANGNETGTGYTTSTGNEQTASPGYTYTYDADGNMITATNTSTGDVWTYSYNFAGQMTGAIETDGGTILAQATYTYDALGNRIGMDENGTQTWTLYDGSDPIMDFNGSGSLTMRYLNGPAGDLVDTVLSRQSASGTIAWYLPDRLGTIRDLINNSGAIIDHVDYSAFGTVLDESNPSNGDRMMGFAGMERDTVTGFGLAVNREENPGTGRWSTRDPLQFSALDVNLYRYVSNSPANSMDASGLAQERPTKDDLIQLLTGNQALMNALKGAKDPFGPLIAGLLESGNFELYFVDMTKNQPAGGGRPYGRTICTTRTIFLAKEYECNPAAASLALLHELTHLAIYDWGGTDNVSTYTEKWAFYYQTLGYMYWPGFPYLPSGGDFPSLERFIAWGDWRFSKYWINIPAILNYVNTNYGNRNYPELPTGGFPNKPGVVPPTFW